MPRPIPQLASRLRDAAARWLARLVDAVVECVQNRPTAALTAALRRTERVPLTQLAALARRKLQRIVDHAFRHSPHYVRIHRAVPGASTQHAFSGILTSRADLRRLARRMVCRAPPRRLLYAASRGTTDDAVPFYWDRRRQAWDRANRRRALAWFGFDLGDRELHLWPVDPPASLGGRVVGGLRRVRDALVAERLIDVERVRGESAVAVVDEWLRFDPQRVTAYPSALCELLAAADRLGLSLRNPALRHVFVTGEVLYDWQRRRIRHALGVDVSSMYGLAEIGAVAFECPAGAWHVASESVWIELVPINSAANATLAEVLLTGLEARTMPLLRYASGDLVQLGDTIHFGDGIQPDGENRFHRAVYLRPTACACRATLPVMPPVIGRRTDFLVDAAGLPIDPARVLAALGPWLGDGRFVVRQRRDRSIDLCHLPPRPCQPSSLRYALEELLAERLDLRVRPVAALPRTRSLKTRYVISEL